MDLGLKGKVAIVTGGSDGIGKATAECLANEGARVIVVARGKERLEAVASAIGGIAVAADVSSADGCAHVIERTLAAASGIDILVNNAGIAASGPFEEISDERWQRDFDLKLFAAIRLSRLAVPEMRKRGGGRIVNVTTIGGKHPGAESMPSSVSRAGGLGMTKALSKELAPANILVNAVCIGLVRAGQHEASARAAGIPVEQLYDSMKKGIPLGRVGDASEAANVITFLVSAAASYVTGASINIDGGTAAVL